MSAPDAETETETDDDRTTIRAGRDFEREYCLSAEEAGRFLVELGEKLRDDEEFVVAGDGWELPFAFGEPVDLEVEFDGTGHPELEVEVAAPGRPDGDGPRIE